MAEPRDRMKFEYSLAQNALPEREGTYHGVFASHETVGLDRFAARVAKANPPLIPATVRAVLAACFAEAADTVADRLCRISADGFVFEAAISGSLPSANAALGAENGIYVAVRLPDSVKAAAEGITPTRADAGDAAVALDAVGLPDGSKTGVIRQTGTFTLTGRNLSASAEGESVYVEPERGEPVAAEVTGEDGLGQRISAAPVAALPEGKAIVYIETYGRNSPADKPHRLHKAVTVLAATPPAPTGDEPEIERGYSEGEGHPDGQVFPLYAFILQGENLTGASVKIGYVEEGTLREVDVPDEKLTVSDSVIRIASDCVELEDAINAGGVVTFTVTTPNGSASYEAEVQE